MDQETKEKGVPKAILQGQQIKCHKDQPLAAPTTQAGGPPQAPPVNNPNRDHAGSTEQKTPNDTANGSTRAPANGKGPGATKSKKKASEPHPGTVASTGPATQSSDSLRNTIICSGCG